MYGFNRKTLILVALRWYMHLLAMNFFLQYDEEVLKTYSVLYCIMRRINYNKQKFTQATKQMKRYNKQNIQKSATNTPKTKSKSQKSKIQKNSKN